MHQEPNIAPLTRAQKRWFPDRRGIAARTRLQVALHLDGIVDLKVFDLALQALVRHNDSLRTRYILSQNGPIQEVMPEYNPKFWHFDASHINENARSAYLLSNLSEMKSSWSVDYGSGENIRSYVFSFSAVNHEIFFDILHISADAACLRLITLKFVKYYNDIMSKSEVYETNEPQYMAYARMEASAAIDSRGDLSTALRRLKPMDIFCNENNAKEFQPAHSGRRFGAGLDKLRKVANGAGTTVPILSVLFIGLILSKWSRRDVVQFGVVSSGRSPSQTDVIGCFARTGPIILDFASVASLPEAIRMANTAYFRAISPKQGLEDEAIAASSVNDITVNYQKKDDGWKASKSIAFSTSRSNFELGGAMNPGTRLLIVLFESARELSYGLSYDADALSRDKVIEFHELFLGALNQISAREALPDADWWRAVRA